MRDRAGGDRVRRDSTKYAVMKPPARGPRRLNRSGRLARTGDRRDEAPQRPRFGQGELVGTPVTGTTSLVRGW
jgi:hypothetical protein